MLELLLLINQLRTKPLVIDQNLTKIAEARCASMDTWSHAGFPKKDIFKLKYRYAGENLARNFNNSKSIIEALEKSPTHKANNHSKNYQKLGIAECNSKVGKVTVFLFAGK